MAFKFIAFASLVAAANAGVLPAVAPLAYAPAAAYAYAAPLAKAVIAPVVKTIEHDAHPRYSFAYDVHDTHTGDVKRQHETRDGDVVRGSYSLIEADGSRRTVDYTADDVHGFNAVVHKELLAHAVETVAAAPLAVKTIAAAPLELKTVAHAPVAYAAPVAHASLAYAAPVAKIATPVAYTSAYSYTAPIGKYVAAPLASHYAYAAPAATYVH